MKILNSRHSRDLGKHSFINITVVIDMANYQVPAESASSLTPVDTV